MKKIIKEGRVGTCTTDDFSQEYDSMEKFIEHLRILGGSYPSNANFRVYKDWNYYDSVEFVFEWIWEEEREETDEEYKRRIKREQKAKEKRISENLSKEEREKALYEKLKAKYGRQD